MFFTPGVGVLKTILIAHIGTNPGVSSLINLYFSTMSDKLLQGKEANTLQQFISHKLFKLLILNLSNEPEFRSSQIHLFNSSTKELKGTETVQTNSVTTIELDKYDFQSDELPVFYSPDMAGIPFGLCISDDKKMLSMEHTHPPASFVLFGDRLKAQGLIKKNWINSLMDAKS